MANTARPKLIVVSNRQPYRAGKGGTCKTVGGLVSALDPLMRSRGGVWIASGNGDEARSGQARLPVPPDCPSYTIRRVPLSAADIEGYYNGYSNRFLWPLCHITLDRVCLTRSYWKSYRKVNRLFAGAVLDEGADNAEIWLQDYHLALCAAEIRSKSPSALLNLFWHIPWPPHAVFRICPQRKEIIEGLLANDLLGFQLESFKENFLRCAESELGARVDYGAGTVFLNGRTTRVRAFPVGVDFGFFDSAARSAEAGSFLRKFLRKKGLEGRLIALSVNRLDYTKGMIKCLEAIDLFFLKYRRYRGKLVFVQIAVPTRKIEPYLSYKKRVRRKVDSINRRYGIQSWRPVEYITADFSHAELAALYRHAVVAVISSVYDGMNLVAKEYVSSQIDLKGALLVSEFAGAAEDIPGVTIINPYDTEGCADALKDAIEASPQMKKKALELARAHVRENDIFKWVRDISGELGTLKHEQIPFEIPRRGRTAA